MWNCFRLMTTLSYQDVLVEGVHMGFYPDTSTSWALQQQPGLTGVGVCNNDNGFVPLITSGAFNSYLHSNQGFARRQMAVAYDPAAISGIGGGANASSTFGTLFPANSCQMAYKSYILTKVNSTNAANGVFQQCIMAAVHLKHLHDFFDKVPLLKGVFFKATLNLNQCTSTITTTVAANALTSLTYTTISPLGGVNPLMVASARSGSAAYAVNASQFSSGSATISAGTAVDTITVSLSVGKTCLNTTQSSIAGVATGTLGSSITLNVPAYTFNPVFETTYLSQPIKRIVYTDVYQYQVLNVSPQAYFNNLITNGIAGIKSILVLPYLSSVGAVAGNTGILTSPILSPFDTAGATTSPMCILGNYNVQLSGQNLIYNTERWTYEQYLNQLYGQRGVNGGLTDGLSSSLVSQLDFENIYNYYYVNASRMLSVEQSVPKSVNIMGQNLSLYAVDLYVFIEYEVSVSVDILTGSRV